MAMIPSTNNSEVYGQQNQQNFNSPVGAGATIGTSSIANPMAAMSPVATANLGTVNPATTGVISESISPFTPIGTNPLNNPTYDPVMQQGLLASIPQYNEMNNGFGNMQNNNAMNLLGQQNNTNVLQKLPNKISPVINNVKPPNLQTGILSQDIFMGLPNNSRQTLEIKELMR